MHPSKPPKITSYGIVAAAAPVVLVIRRGPSKLVQLLLWNLYDDSITAGQWLKGGVEPHTVGLSPDASTMIYEARKHGSTITVLSRPPYFTALAFWSFCFPGSGGGFFESDDSVVLYAPVDDVRRGGAIPTGLRVTQGAEYAQRIAPGAPFFLGSLDYPPEVRQGWTVRGQEAHKPRPRVRGGRLERTRSGAIGRVRGVYVVVDGGRTTELGALDWADWSHDGQLLLGDGALLFRQRDPHDPSTRVCVADLHEWEFEKIVAPSAMRRWPERLREARRRRGRG